MVEALVGQSLSLSTRLQLGSDQGPCLVTLVKVPGRLACIAQNAVPVTASKARGPVTYVPLRTSIYMHTLHETDDTMLRRSFGLIRRLRTRRLDKSMHGNREQSRFLICSPHLHCCCTLVYGQTPMALGLAFGGLLIYIDILSTLRPHDVTLERVIGGQV